MIKDKILICIDLVEKWLHRLRNKIEIKNSLGVRSLSPINELEREDVYLQMLDYAVRDKNISNIAISGEYGVGKSSIIESFKKQFKNYKTINISLATFLEEQDVESDKLEEHIIKQLFYKVSSKK